MGKGGKELLLRQPEPGDFRDNHRRRREEALAKIRKLRHMFSLELLAAALFLLLSVAAFQDFSFLPSLPDYVRKALGRPPSVNMISAALIVYIFSAIILVLSRMMSGSGKSTGLGHVGYTAGFYFFYHFSGALPGNIWAVFAAGATIIALECYHLWIYCSEEIEKERESLAALGKILEGRD